VPGGILGAVTSRVASGVFVRRATELTVLGGRGTGELAGLLPEFGDPRADSDPEIWREQKQRRDIAGADVGQPAALVWALGSGRQAEHHVGLEVPAGGVRPVSQFSSGVTVASASARLARECGARCGHFISAYATACCYQVTGSGSGTAHASGSPVAGANARPLQAARTSSAR